jgi:GTP-sensing pleiotropic transcriptional regulator CodY
MTWRLNLRRRSLLVACVFIMSVFLVMLKLMNPTEIHIYLEGEETVLSQIMKNYTFFDVVLLVASSLVAGMSVIYLMLFDDQQRPTGEMLLESRLSKYEGLIPTLKDDEQKIFRAIIDAQGIIAQSELTEVTGVSKSNVSRALDLLESRGLVERRRRGMSNTILLK